MGCEGMVVAPISYNQLIKKNKNKRISQLNFFFSLRNLKTLNRLKHTILKAEPFQMLPDLLL